MLASATVDRQRKCDDHMPVIADDKLKTDIHCTAYLVRQDDRTTHKCFYLINELQSCSGCSDEDNTFVRSCCRSARCRAISES